MTTVAITVTIEVHRGWRVDRSTRGEDSCSWIALRHILTVEVEVAIQLLYRYLYKKLLYYCRPYG